MALSFHISKMGIIKSTSLWFYALEEKTFMEIFL